MTTAKTKKTNPTIRRKIREVVKDLEKQGWQVRADIRGRTAPDLIGDKAPDIEAMKEGGRLLIQVETFDTMEENDEFLTTFIRHARNRWDTRFDLVIARTRKSSAKSKSRKKVA
jgi:hypothetical protein